jgi:hypothetical protein
LHYFRCISTNFTQIYKIITDVKLPFDGGCGQLIHLGTWWLYVCVFFYYRSLGGCCRFSNDGTPQTHSPLSEFSDLPAAVPAAERQSLILDMRWASPRNEGCRERDSNSDSEK